MVGGGLGGGRHRPVQGAAEPGAGHRGGDRRGHGPVRDAVGPQAVHGVRSASAGLPAWRA